VATLNVGSLGDYIRDQRRSAQYSLRQLAEVAGVSNPYLSQIERGLKKPSAEILQQIAKALRISAETLYVRAGFLEDRGSHSDVVAAVLADTAIDERHKRVLIDIYESFRSGTAAGAVVQKTSARKRPASKRTASKRTASKSTAGKSTSSSATSSRKAAAPSRTTSTRTTTSRRKSA
jgi:transcriptional regulator with XRE-family HTH domain